MRLALVAAQRAEEQRLAALDAHDVDATVAHHLAAMGAFVGGRAPADGAGRDITPSASTTGGFGRARSNLRNRDVGVGGFDEQFHVAQMHRLAGQQPRFLDGFAVDKRAVGGVAIAE